MCLTGEDELLILPLFLLLPLPSCSDESPEVHAGCWPGVTPRVLSPQSSPQKQGFQVL